MTGFAVKTIVAIHRAAHLARRNPDSRILLATFSQPLANALAAKIRLLLTGMGQPRLGERIEVHAMESIGRRLYELNIGKLKLATESLLSELLQKASRTVGDHKFSLRFLTTEWEQVVDAWQLDSWEEYRDVSRLGRKTRLKEPQRQLLWSIFEQVRSGLRDRGAVTSSGMFNVLARHYRNGGAPPFEFCVIDEAQDISIAQLRFLSAISVGQANGLFFSGDLGQRIFHQPFSWKAAGVDVRGRSATLKVSTMHLAKGLEFRAVGVMACDDEVIPLQGRIETVTDDSDLEDVYNTERQLLYVACTRARDHLLVTSTEPASEFLEDLSVTANRNISS
ncbi:MAG: 3'-5' exonuclease [Acidobacteriaceae bacterium]